MPLQQGALSGDAGEVETVQSCRHTQSKARRKRFVDLDSPQVKFRSEQGRLDVSPEVEVIGHKDGRHLQRPQFLSGQANLLQAQPAPPCRVGRSGAAWIRGSQGIRDREVDVEPGEERRLGPPVQIAQAQPERSVQVDRFPGTGERQVALGGPLRLEPCQVGVRRRQRIPQEGAEDRTELGVAQSESPLVAPDFFDTTRLPLDPQTAEPFQAAFKEELFVLFGARSRSSESKVQRILREVEVDRAPEGFPPPQGQGDVYPESGVQVRLQVDVAGQILAHRIAGG